METVKREIVKEDWNSSRTSKTPGVVWYSIPSDNEEAWEWEVPEQHVAHKDLCIVAMERKGFN